MLKTADELFITLYIYSLTIQSPKLRMLMEAKHLAFRFGGDQIHPDFQHHLTFGEPGSQV